MADVIAEHERVALQFQVKPGGTLGQLAGDAGLQLLCRLVVAVAHLITLQWISPAAAR
ncbi:hypothetical protein D3C84_1044680 [compost metagenome]